MKTTRRNLLMGGAVAAVGLVVARPEDTGGPYSDYFAQLNQTLRAAGIDRPVLVVDLDRLDRNIDRVVKSAAVAPAKTYRIVLKSVPSPALVDYIAKRANTRALMSFHRPFLQTMAALRPDSDILMGKPLPVSAARLFYAQHTGTFDPAKQLQWLIDTDDRLLQYLALAKELGVRMRVSMELDVGLRRGGFGDPQALSRALAVLAQHPQYLQLGGLMGYDAHLMGLPTYLAERELPQVKARYEACVALVRSQFPKLAQEPLVFNGAGSPTFRHYEGDMVVNDLSAGSCLMKPTHYDLPILQDFEASCFIASPVLKRQLGAWLPVLDGAGSMIRAWNPNHAQMYFAYGGNWLAECEAPPGLRPHFVYASSNQQGYSASESVALKIDDFIFLRPTQSEAVLLQFGDLVAVRGNKIESHWPVLPVST